MEEKKGFFKTLMSKPQTLEEAKRKTRKNMLLVGIVFGVFAVLFSLLHIIFGGIWAIFAAGVMVYFYVSWHIRDKRNFCSNCGAKFDYERCVSWVVEEAEIKSLSTNANSNRKQIIKKEITKLRFTCTCEECGNEKEFYEKFDTVLWYDDGSQKHNNLREMVKNYFNV